MYYSITEGRLLNILEQTSNGGMYNGDRVFLPLLQGSF